MATLSLMARADFRKDDLGYAIGGDVSPVRTGWVRGAILVRVLENVRSGDTGRFEELADVQAERDGWQRVIDALES
jgi:hypothetical protein